MEEFQECEEIWPHHKIESCIVHNASLITIWRSWNHYIHILLEFLIIKFAVCGQVGNTSHLTWRNMKWFHPMKFYPRGLMGRWCFLFVLEMEGLLKDMILANLGTLFSRWLGSWKTLLIFLNNIKIYKLLGAGMLDFMKFWLFQNWLTSWNSCCCNIHNAVYFKWECSSTQ